MGTTNWTAYFGIYLEQFAHPVPVDDNGIGTVGVTLVDDVVEVFDEILCVALVLLHDFHLTVGVECSTVVFVLTEFAHIVSIDARLLVEA